MVNMVCNSVKNGENRVCFINIILTRVVGITSDGPFIHSGVGFDCKLMVNMVCNSVKNCENRVCFINIILASLYVRHNKYYSHK